MSHILLNIQKKNCYFDCFEVCIEHYLNSFSVVYHSVYNIIYLPTQCTNVYDLVIKLTYTKMPSARC